MTAAAKAKFSSDVEDIRARGERLIQESLAAGVTCMRAFVEVDAIVGRSCLDVALHLKNEWADQCDIQICSMYFFFLSEATCHVTLLNILTNTS